MKNQPGFTLIELMIVIAIISILATLSVPQYSRYIAKEKLRTAQSDLQLLSLKYEHRYQRVLTYPATQFDNSSDFDSEIQGWIPASDPGDVNFSSVNATTSSYTLRATGVAGSIKDCVISLTHDGTRTISNCDTFAKNGAWL